MLGRTVWSVGTLHDLLLVAMIEEAERTGVVEQAVIDSWRPLASFYDIAFSVEEEAGDQFVASVLKLVDHAVAEFSEMDKTVRMDLTDLAVFEHYPVSQGGHVEFDRSQLLDVATGVAQMLRGDLPPDPEEGRWFLGRPGGRSVAVSLAYRLKNEG